MNFKFLFAALLFLFIGGIHASAQTTLQPRNYYKVLAASGGIVNTEADTVALALSLDKVNYRYNYVLTRTTGTGTLNIAAVLQESNETTGTTNWYTIGTFTGTGAGVVNLSGAQTYGVRHRIILTGTGTQSSTYRLTARLTRL